MWWQQRNFNYSKRECVGVFLWFSCLHASLSKECLDKTQLTPESAPTLMLKIICHCLSEWPKGHCLFAVTSAYCSFQKYFHHFADYSSETVFVHANPTFKSSIYTDCVQLFSNSTTNEALLFSSSLYEPWASSSGAIHGNTGFKHWFSQQETVFSHLSTLARSPKTPLNRCQITDKKRFVFSP